MLFNLYVRRSSGRHFSHFQNDSSSSQDLSEIHLYKYRCEKKIKQTAWIHYNYLGSASLSATFSLSEKSNDNRLTGDNWTVHRRVIIIILHGNLVGEKNT